MSFVVVVTVSGADSAMKRARERIMPRGIVIVIVEKRASFGPSFFRR